MALTRSLALCAVFALAACGRAPSLSECAERDIESLQQSMRTGELTAEALTQCYLARIDSIDRNGPMLNAIIAVNPDALAIARDLDAERAAAGPRGPLHGIPVLVKDNIDTGDSMATTAGSLALAGHLAAGDAFVVARLRDAGAVILGKANLSEWANFRSTRSSSGWSSVGGQTRNPYDTARNPCGSSSGSAVAVAASLAAVAVGTETDGSVVCPASANGIVGIKPTLGLVSRSGIIPVAVSQDTAGPMARTVRDAALLLDAVVGRDGADPLADAFPDAVPNFSDGLTTGALQGARIGVLRNYSGAGDDPRVDAIFDDSVERLRALGADIVDAVEIDTGGMGDAEYTVLLYEFKAGLNDYLAGAGAGVRSLADVIEFNEANADAVMPIFGQEILLAAEEKGSLAEPEYLEALATSKRIARAGLNGALSEHELDAIVAPTLGPPAVIDHIHGDHWPGAYSAPLAAVSGYASITVPAGHVRGMPVGLSFIGGAFSDAALIRFAYAFEQATRVRRPPEIEP